MNKQFLSTTKILCTKHPKQKHEFYHVPENIKCRPWSFKQQFKYCNEVKICNNLTIILKACQCDLQSKYKTTYYHVPKENLQAFLCLR